MNSVVPSPSNWLPDGQHYRKSAGDEPLPGYRLTTPLGKGGFGEVWECEAPGGLRKAIKFVFDDSDDRPSGGEPFRQEYQAFQQIKQIRHPFLLTLERVELVGGHLVMVMELADQNLAERFDECRATGLSGIPRDELLGYFADAAEALDVLATKHSLQHLDVKPANLFLLGGRAKVGDFGLVRPQQVAKAAADRGLTPRYVPPEVLQGRVDPRSDQYSLALVYQELLTSSFAYECKSPAHMLFQHATAEPNLRGLPGRDVAVVRRALAKNPNERWPTCAAFVEALMDAPDIHGNDDTIQNMTGSSLLMRRARIARAVADQPKPASPSGSSPSPIPPVIRKTGFFTPNASTAFVKSPESRPAAPLTPGDALVELIAEAPPSSNPTPPHTSANPADVRRTPFGPSPNRLLRSTVEAMPSCAPGAASAIRLPKVWSVAPLSLLTGGSAIPDYRPSTAEFSEAVVRAAVPDGGKPPGPGEFLRVGLGWECRFPVKLMSGMLELKVAALREVWTADLVWPDARTAVLRVYYSSGLLARIAGRESGVEVAIQFPEPKRVIDEAVVSARVFGSPHSDYARTAAHILPRMVDDARTALANHADHRLHARVAADFPMQLFPVTADGTVYPPLWGKCQNVSVGGVAFEAAGSMPTGYVYASFAGVGAANGWAILTRLIRSKADPHGYSFAGRFRTDH